MFLASLPIAVGLVVFVEAAGTTPTIDIARTCRESEKAVALVVGDVGGANFDNCMRQEQAAREVLVKDWATYPAPDRGRCVAPSAYMPSYIEWLTCLENAKAVRSIPREP